MYFRFQAALLEYSLVLDLWWVHRHVVQPYLRKVTEAFPSSPSGFEMAAKRTGWGYFLPAGYTLRVNPLTNTAQVLIQNLARRQGICFITKYTGLDFHLLTPTEIILWGMGRLAPHKFSSSYGLLAPPTVAPGAHTLPALFAICATAPRLPK